MDIADWIALGVGAIGGLFGFLGWRKAREANRIAEMANFTVDEANRISREANALSQTANSFAREANDIAKRSAKMENEPHIRVDITYRHVPGDGSKVYRVDVRAINYGRVDVVMESASLYFWQDERSGSFIDLPRLEDRIWNTIDFPFELKPGRSIEIYVDADWFYQSALSAVESGERCYIVFHDVTRRDYKSNDIGKGMLESLSIMSRGKKMRTKGKH